MRKVLLLLAVVAFGFLLASCKEKVDPAEAKLQTAYDSLNALIADPSNITGGFEVPTTLVGGVTADWESSNPGVVTVGAANNGFAVITVNRPAFGEPNVNVTLSVTLTIASELDETKDLTMDWSVVLTVKANEVEEIVIESIADVLEVTDPEYDGTYQVSLENLTIFAKGSDASFAYDGTGIIQVYGGSQENLVIGKVYTIDATIEWYFGIWELTKWTATEQTTATPATPTAEVIESVNTKIDALVTAEEHLYAGQDASAGNFESIYATVTGKVYMVPGDTSNYNTYIVDTAYDTTQAWVPGSAGVPARGFMVYYNTQDLATLRLYDGITVTIDVVIYTYRSNNQAFAIYYVGGPEGIEAVLTDEQKLDIDSNAITVPAAFTEAGTVDLPVLGANGSTIAWTSSNEALVNPTTGVVTLPTEGAEIVTLTATVTYGTLTPVEIDFEILVGELPTVTMASHLTLADGDLAYTEVEILYLASNGKSAVVGDSTGYGYIYASFDMSTEVAVGDFVGVTFTIDIYNGLYELVDIEFSEAAGTDPNLTPTAVTWTATDAEALLTNPAWAPAYVTMELLGYASGNFTNAYLEGFYPNYVQTNGATAELQNKVFTATGWIIGRSSSKITIQGTYTNAVDLTDWANVLLDTKDLALTTTAYTEATTVTLPATGTRGTTITWASSNEALFNPTTGAVTLPESGTVEVTLTATITKGTSSETKAFTITITKPAAVEVFASDLFISEYIEGSAGNNKAIEIFNGTGAAVDLSIYTLKVNANANTTWGSAIALTGTLAHGEVYVVINSGADWVGLTSNQDLGTSSLSPNGDDAIGLFKNDVLIDIFGVFAEDPGTGWAIGDITNATVDNTIVRNSSVKGPKAVWDTTEWTVVGKDDTTKIGAHVFTPSAE
jgi:hypothetical protein